MGEKQKIKLSTILQPNIASLGIYPREMKTYVDAKPVLECFVAVLLIMAKIWNQIRCPSMGEWLNELDVPIPWNTAISKEEHYAGTFNNLHKSPENYAKLKKKKKAVPKDHILYGSIFIMFLK